MISEDQLLREELIDVKGRKIIALQKKIEKGTLFTVVPGYVVESHCQIKQIPRTRNFNKNIFYLVEPVSNVEEQLDIIKILRKKGFEGPINWW